MIRLITILLSISLSSVAYAGNSIYITQVGTADDLTLTINQDGNDNSVNLSIAHDDNTLDFHQEGNNNTISWVSYWGSGLSWGGDLDGSNNTLRFKQYNTTGSDSNRIGFHIPSNGNIVDVCQGATFPDMSSSSCSGTSSEYGGHTVNLDLHSGGNTVKIGQQTGSGNQGKCFQYFKFYLQHSARS